MTSKKHDAGRPSKRVVANTEGHRKPCRAAVALKTILGLTPAPDVFCNIAGTPCIRLPPTEGGPDCEEWPLPSSRVRVWVAETIWDKNEVVLSDREITQILTVLEGKAWHDQRLDWDLKDAMDQDPVLEAVVVWSEKKERFEGTPTKLLEVLSKTAKKCGVDMQGKTWPKGAAQLSLRLNKLLSPLLRAGVEVEVGRRPGGQRYIVLSNTAKAANSHKGCDDATQAASLATAIDKSHHPKSLQRSDDGGGDVFEKVKNLP
jgi:hypothetical protein